MLLSGTGNHSLAKQLSTCTSQWTALFTGMGGAIACVTHAELNVIRRASGSARYYDLDTLDREFMSHTADDVSHLPAALFGKLAAAMPLLQHLSLQGYCEDVAFNEFGKHCPRLQSLKVEALNTRLSSLKNIHQVLPSLAHFTVSNRGPVNKQHCICYLDDIRSYVDSCCGIICDCSDIKILQLDLWVKHEWLGSEVVIECSKSVWDCLPPSLDELRCDVELRDIQEMSVFMSRVRVLQLVDIAYCELPELMKIAPCLEKLTVEQGQAVDMMWSDESVSPAELSNLKERLLNGFQLNCERVCFTGSSIAIKDVMSWLSPLKGTTHCDVEYTDSVHDLAILEELTRVCPNVKRLKIVDDSASPSGWPQAQVVNLRDLQLLAQMHLKCLDIRLELGPPGKVCM